jgi:TonB family protein
MRARSGFPRLPRKSQTSLRQTAAVKYTVLPILLLIACASAPASAADPIFTRSDPPPGEIDPGAETLPWADAADFQAGTPESNLARWTAQANAGRARAATLVGRHWLERIPQSSDNCATALEWLQKADKLGSNEAAGWLGHLYRRFDCPQRDLKSAAAWLRKAVPLRTYGAAGDLVDIHATEGAPEYDLSQAYLYSRIAAPEVELTPAATELQSRQATLLEKLDAGQRESAREQADKLLADMDRRRLAMRAPPREEKLKASSSGSAWNLGLVAYDDLRECAANTAGNCRGVRRLAYFVAENKGQEYLRCKLSLDHRDFSTGKLETHSRETLLPPRSTRRLIAGRVGEVANKGDLRAECAPIAGLAADVAAGKCKAVTTGVPSVSDFYPPGSRRRNEEGRVLLYVWLDKKEGQPAIVELMGSSGYPELDQAGVKMGTYMAFRSECDYGWLPFAVGFRLQDAN